MNTGMHCGNYRGAGCTEEYTCRCRCEGCHEAVMRGGEEVMHRRSSRLDTERARLLRQEYYRKRDSSLSEDASK